MNIKQPWNDFLTPARACYSMISQVDLCSTLLEHNGSNVWDGKNIKQTWNDSLIQGWACYSIISQVGLCSTFPFFLTKTKCISSHQMTLWPNQWVHQMTLWPKQWVLSAFFPTGSRNRKICHSEWHIFPQAGATLLLWLLVGVASILESVPSLRELEGNTFFILSPQICYAPQS